MTTTTSATQTNFLAGTLSNEDREMFLRGHGLTEQTPKDQADRIRSKWTDEKILELMELGLF